MTKIVCDICGNDVHEQRHRDSDDDYELRLSSYGKVWDICKECRKELNKWIKQRKEIKEQE